MYSFFSDIKNTLKQTIVCFRKQKWCWWFLNDDDNRLPFNMVIQWILCTSVDFLIIICMLYTREKVQFTLQFAIHFFFSLKLINSQLKIIETHNQSWLSFFLVPLFSFMFLNDQWESIIIQSIKNHGFFLFIFSLSFTINNKCHVMPPYR